MTLNEYLTSIADAIRTKNGSEEKINAGDFATKILSIKSGGIVSVAKKDVNFYDYEGTRLYSYTLAEAQALTTLPDLPEHEGLVAQQWTYTLDEIKSSGCPVNVGVSYTTNDGNTRLYINISENVRTDVKLCFNQKTAHGVTIDWGDGSATETSGDTNVKVIHTYPNIGDYVITLNVAAKCTLQLGLGMNTTSVLGDSTYGYNTSKLKKVELGNGIEYIQDYCFNNYYSLETITMPNSISYIGSHCFDKCRSLKHVALSRAVFQVGQYAFNECSSLRRIIFNPAIGSQVTSNICYNCKSLDEIILPIKSVHDNAFYGCESAVKLIFHSGDGYTDFGNYAFYGCKSLQVVKNPKKMTGLYSNTFGGCDSLKVLDFTSVERIPDVSGGKLSGIPSDCEIRVPAALYDAWIAASNWSYYVSQIVAV